MGAGARMGGDGRGDSPRDVASGGAPAGVDADWVGPAGPAADSAAEGDDVSPRLVRGLAAAPGPGLVTALTEAVAGGPELGVVPRGGSSAPWRRTVRVFSAGRRLEGWVLWCRLRDVAALVLAWQACPPIDSGCGGEPGEEVVEGFDGDDRCAMHEPELVARLHRAARVYERADEPAVRVHRHCSGVGGGACASAGGLGAERGVRAESGQRGGDGDRCRSPVHRGPAPGTGSAAGGGWVDWAKARLFVSETSCLHAAVARAVDAVVLGPVADADPARLAGSRWWTCWPTRRPGSGVPVIARWTLTQLKDAIRAAILELDAAAAAKRAEHARRRRHVRVRGGGRDRGVRRGPARRGRRRRLHLPDQRRQGRQSQWRPAHPGPAPRRRTGRPRHPRRHPHRTPTR